MAGCFGSQKGQALNGHVWLLFDFVRLSHLSLLLFFSCLLFGIAVSTGVKVFRRPALMPREMRNRGITRLRFCKLPMQDEAAHAIHNHSHCTCCKHLQHPAVWILFSYLVLSMFCQTQRFPCKITALEVLKFFRRKKAIVQAQRAQTERRGPESQTVAKS